MIDKFLSPEAMLTPGVAGGTTMVIANALANNFEILSRNRSGVGLLLSFIFGLLVMTSPRQWWVRITYYVLNSLIIFCVAFGSGNLLVAPSAQGPGDTAYILVPAAHAQNPNTSKPTGEVNPSAGPEKSQGADAHGPKTQHPGPPPNASRSNRSWGFFRPWSNPFR
jgi:hypothetical protein